MFSSEKILDYLNSVYCVGKTAFSFSFDQKFFKKTIRVFKTIKTLKYLKDIACVFKTAFSINCLIQTKKRPRKRSQNRKNPLKRRLFNIYLNTAFKNYLGRFYRLRRVNQVITAGCVLTIILASTIPVWFIHWQNNLGKSGTIKYEAKPYSAPRDSVSGKPAMIKIPSLQVDLPVIEGKYDPNTNSWTLTNNNAQYLVDSAQPNNISGKTFIYGHALKNIFGGLHNIQPGASLTIVTNNGYSFNYRFISSFKTSPSDISVLSNSHRPELYIQTCSGSFYQYRQIFSFKYVGYEKA